MSDSNTPSEELFQIVDPSDGAESSSALSRSDTVGIALSVLCAIHCAATPVLLAMLPALGLSTFGLSTLEQPWVHQALFVGCVLLAGFALLRGFRVHGRRWVPGLASVGLLLLAASAFVWPAPCCAGDVCEASEAAAVFETTGGESNDAAEGANRVRSADGRHAHCEHCVHGEASRSTAVDEPSVSSASESSPALRLRELWLRLLTPLGGVFLIVAHGLNIRWTRDCRCGCCPT